MTDEHLEIKIVSGLSGSGKSTALRALEDVGTFCIDNLPAALMVPFADLCDERPDVSRVALGIDVRSEEFWEGVEQALVEFDRRLYQVEIIFLDAADEVLMRRFSETRRPHPLAAYGDVLTGISQERKVTSKLRERADRIVDTSRMDVHQLRRTITEHLTASSGRTMRVRVQSFGFKYGIPIDSDLVLDVRFLPNPYFVEKLRALSGLDSEIVQYVLESPEGREHIEQLETFLRPLLPKYEEEGKSTLTISVGCTGGRHRSVAIAEALAARLSDSWTPDALHRDIDR